MTGDEQMPAGEVCPTCACADGMVDVGLKLLHTCMALRGCDCRACAAYPTRVHERLVAVVGRELLERLIPEPSYGWGDRARADIEALGVAVVRLARIENRDGAEFCTEFCSGIVDPERVTLVDGELVVMPPVGFR